MKLVQMNMQGVKDVLYVWTLCVDSLSSPQTLAFSWDLWRHLQEVEAGFVWSKCSRILNSLTYEHLWGLCQN